ncbi:uncharacterized protein C2orf74 homolog [Dromiciops gliroides]|uniref:uncharacterized protein C2orf74 homolog n=1 Tax=Dromiciops gliroides TaxID=33562 RepID=UPI001CC6BBA2|nr:uncharacterized protein C2orf74 homolog [Dromiciops gliroides]
MPKIISVLQCVDGNIPVKPVILVQRQDSKHSLVMPLENAETREEKRKIMEFHIPKWSDGAPEKENCKMSEEEHLISNPFSTENNRRPKREVTFSQEVIVVDLGEENNDEPQCYTREHKDKK